jgi:hypothetical protein
MISHSSMISLDVGRLCNDRPMVIENLGKW